MLRERNLMLPKLDLKEACVSQINFMEINISSLDLDQEIMKNYCEEPHEWYRWQWILFYESIGVREYATRNYEEFKNSWAESAGQYSTSALRERSFIREEGDFSLVRRFRSMRYHRP